MKTTSEDSFQSKKGAQSSVELFQIFDQLRDIWSLYGVVGPAAAHATVPANTSPRLRRLFANLCMDLIKIIDAHTGRPQREKGIKILRSVSNPPPPQIFQISLICKPPLRSTTIQKYSQSIRTIGRLVQSAALFEEGDHLERVYVFIGSLRQSPKLPQSDAEAPHVVRRRIDVLGDGFNGQPLDWSIDVVA